MSIKERIQDGFRALGYDLRRIEEFSLGDDPRSERVAVPCNIINANIGGERIRFFVLDERDSIQTQHMRGRFYEAEELAIIREHFSGGVFVDVGSNVGNHAIYAAKMLRAQKVIAFEPNPTAYRILRFNAILNGIEDRCVIHALGLSDQRGRASIETPVRNLGGTRLSRSGTNGPSELVRGDDVLLGEDVAFIKIDTEGLEMQVLAGLSGTIARCRPTMFIEVEEANRPALQEFLTTQGYRSAAAYKRYPENVNFLVRPLG